MGVTCGLYLNLVPSSEDTKAAFVSLFCKKWRFQWFIRDLSRWSLKVKNLIWPSFSRSYLKSAKLASISNILIRKTSRSNLWTSDWNSCDTWTVLSVFMQFSYLLDESCATACYSYVISPLVNSYIISSYVFGRRNQYKSKDVQVYGNESPWRCEN